MSMAWLARSIAWLMLPRRASMRARLASISELRIGCLEAPSGLSSSWWRRIAILFRLLVVTDHEQGSHLAEVELGVVESEVVPGVRGRLVGCQEPSCLFESVGHACGVAESRLCFGLLKCELDGYTGWLGLQPILTSCGCQSAIGARFRAPVSDHLDHSESAGCRVQVGDVSERRYRALDQQWPPVVPADPMCR